MSAPDSCPDCTAAAAGVWAGFKSTCDGCKARAIGRSPACYEARNASPQDDDFHQVRKRYRDMLDAAGITHEQVKAARSKDYQEAPA